MKRGAWMLYRLEHMLKPEMTTAEVRKTLKISDPVLRRWLANPYFKKNAVAIQDENGKWIWQRGKLVLWVIAMMKLKPEKMRIRRCLSVASNPPQRDTKPIALNISMDAARDALDIPSDYTIPR